MSLPLICIVADTAMLDPIYRQAWECDPRSSGKPYPEPSEIEVRVKAYEAQWAAEGHKLLQGMCEKLGLHFRQNLIYVHVVGRAAAMSHPVVLDAGYSPEHFVDVLTHELLHQLFFAYQEGSGGEVWEILNRKFLSESGLTKNHILLHAVHAHLFLDVLRAPNRLARDVDWAQDRPAYKRAWDIVGDEGYDELIREFKEDEKWPGPPSANRAPAYPQLLGCDGAA